MNPISAIVSGTTRAATSASKQAATAVGQNIPKPSEAVYNLGLGVGPLLRSIVDELSASKGSQTKEADKNTTALSGKKELAQLSSQFNTMISIMRDIKNIGMMQLRRDQQLALESRRMSFFEKEAEQESRAIRPAGTTGADKNAGRASESPLSNIAHVLGIAGALPSVIKGLVAGAGAFAVWNYVFDDTTRKLIKDSITGLLFGKEGTDDGGVIGKFGDMIGSAFSSAPVLTLIAAAVAARVTGLLGIGAAAFKLGGLVGRGASVRGPAIVAPPTSTALPAQVGAAAARPAAASTTTGKLSPLERVRQQQSIAESNRALAGAAGDDAAKAAVATTKASTALTKATTMLSRGLLAGAAVSGGVSSYQNFKEGKTISGSLNALSALLATGAIGTAVTGVGAPIAGVLAGASALTGVAGWISSYFESGKANAPAPSSTQPSPMSASSGDDFMERYKEIVGQRESGGDYNKFNSLGFLGKYQFGAMALEDLGFLKQGASKKVKKDGDQNPVLNDPSNWKGGYNREKFLNDPRAQEEAFVKYTQANMRVLKNAGIITDKTSQSELSGLLMAAHLAGANGVVKHFKSGGARDPSDAYGTRLTDYLAHGRNAFNTSLENDVSLLARAMGTPQATGVAPNQITGMDSSNADVLSQFNESISNWMRSAQSGFGVFNVNQSRNTAVTNQSGASTGLPTHQLGDSMIRSAVTSLA
jgi:hypothetical protein